MKNRKDKGFTLIELLVVIAIIALLMSIVMPSLGKAKVYARKIICRNNIRQQCLGVMLYGNDNASWVPTSDIGWWLWDMSFWSTNQISEYAGFDENEIFYCPSNRLKKADDARFWQFSWVGSFGADVTQEVPLRDENVLTLAQQKSVHYRVMPTLYMFDQFDASGDSTRDPVLYTGKDAKWISKLSKLKNSSSSIMIMDNVISEVNGWQFFKIEAGGVWTTFNTYDSSNHKSNQKTGPNREAIQPDGANVGYADGHVSWLSYGNMEHQVTSDNAVWFWW